VNLKTQAMKTNLFFLLSILWCGNVAAQHNISLLQYNKQPMSSSGSLEHRRAVRELTVPRMITDTSMLLLDSIHTFRPGFIFSRTWEAFLYNSRGNLAIDYNYTGAFETNFYKTVYDYLPNDSILCITSFSQKINGSPSLTAYENFFTSPMYTDSFFYNTNGFLEKYLMIDISGEFRIMYSYNGNNKLVTRLAQKRFVIPTIWEDIDKTTYQRDSMDRDTSEYHYGKYMNEFFLYKDRITDKHYDLNNRVCLKQIYDVGIFDSTDVTLSAIQHYTYDSMGNISKSVVKEIKHYSPIIDTLYVVQDFYARCFDVLDSMVWYYGYSSNPQFTSKSRFLYFYSTWPCLPDSMYSQTYDFTLGAYKDVEKQQYTFDAYGNLVKKEIYYMTNNQWAHEYTADFYYGWHLITALGKDEPIVSSDRGGLHLFPNPTKGIISLSLPAGIPFNIQIYNTKGQLIKSEAGRSTLDLSSHPAGLYLVRVIQGNNVYQQKVLKQ